MPLAQAEYDGQQLTVPYDKAQVKDAPHHDPGQEISVGDEQQLYQHYDLSRSRSAAPPAGQQGRYTSGPNTDEAMTRSEEQMHVGTEQHEVGRARPRKHMVTEQVNQTVPVSHEEVRIEREPITEANRDQAMAGGDITEEEHDITLNAERPVVSKETTPVERVRLGKETVTGEETVTGDVRKEQIDDPQTAQKKQQNQ